MNPQSPQQSPTPPQPPTAPEQPQQPHDYSQPVAYDIEGRPLYYAPPEAHRGHTQNVQPTPQQQEPQVSHQLVHVSRATEPFDVPISPEVQARHDESVQKYPFLNLSEAEYVISAVRRHPIGLIAPMISAGVVAIILLVVLIALPAIVASIGLVGVSLAPLYVAGVMMLLLVGIGAYISVWVYRNNQFFLTNESVIQEIQTSLFARHEQTVSLSSIEDASFRKEGVLQSMLDYGSIRLSTEGDETTYRFNYVSHPKDQIAVLNNAVESFKNGRPVTGD